MLAGGIAVDHPARGLDARRAARHPRDRRRHPAADRGALDAAAHGEGLRGAAPHARVPALHRRVGEGAGASSPSARTSSPSTCRTRSCSARPRSGPRRSPASATSRPTRRRGTCRSHAFNYAGVLERDRRLHGDDVGHAHVVAGVESARAGSAAAGSPAVAAAEVAAVPGSGRTMPTARHREEFAMPDPEIEEVLQRLDRLDAERAIVETMLRVRERPRLRRPRSLPPVLHRRCGLRRRHAHRCRRGVRIPRARGADEVLRGPHPCAVGVAQARDDQPVGRDPRRHRARASSYFLRVDSGTESAPAYVLAPVGTSTTSCGTKMAAGASGHAGAKWRTSDGPGGCS